MKMCHRHLVFLAAAALVGCGSKAPPPATQPPPSARVETQPAPAAVYGDPATPVAGSVLGTVIHTQDVEELRYVVLKALTDRYAASKGIEATQAEREAYAARVRDELSKDPAVAGMPENESAEDQAARLEIAAAFILQWKINRALYQQYGGRIGFQQGGPEPLDAYRKFLEESASRGDFKIVNKDLEGEFWRYYRDESIHDFFQPGSAEEAKAFASPPWLADQTQRPGRVTATRPRGTKVR